MTLRQKMKSNGPVKGQGSMRLRYAKRTKSRMSVVGSTVRLASLPDLPTSAEAGLPEFEAQGWNGLFAPKGTPAEIVAKLNAAARTAVESDIVKKRFADLSTVAPDAGEHGSEVLGHLVSRDVEKYRKLLEEKK